ncbi:sigma-70 family RNA polymerase sigma factor [Streptomyces longisporus]|uniref:RNA polymerase sigma factor n=1 Tax=Streptomyces longisporus TaxID=1948 RepID=A0ABN3LGI5_STRLO
MFSPATSTRPEHSPARAVDWSSERIDALMRDLAALPRGPRRAALRDRVIQLLLPVARRAARRFRAGGEDFDDLVQVACLGLIKAVDGYDPTLGHAFLSYAMPTIVGEIKRHLRDRTMLMRLPRPIQEARSQVFQAVEELEQRHGGQRPSAEQVAEHTGLGLPLVISTLRAVRECSPRYLDAETDNGGGSPLISLIGSEDSALGLAVDTLALATALKRLPERERHILYLRFYEDRTQQQIADAVGVSQMQISRILAHCFARLREALDECVPAPRAHRTSHRPAPPSPAHRRRRTTPRRERNRQPPPTRRPRHRDTRIEATGTAAAAPSSSPRGGRGRPSRSRSPLAPCAARLRHVRPGDRLGHAVAGRTHRARGAAGLPRPPPNTPDTPAIPDIPGKPFFFPSRRR